MTEEIESAARAIYELREARNFPTEGHVPWERTTAAVRSYNYDLAIAALGANRSKCRSEEAAQSVAKMVDEWLRIGLSEDAIDQFARLIERRLRRFIEPTGPTADDDALSSKCPSCNGTGVVADYVGLEMKPVGVGCEDCGGSGTRRSAAADLKAAVIALCTGLALMDRKGKELPEEIRHQCDALRKAAGVKENNR